MKRLASRQRRLEWILALGLWSVTWTASAAENRIDRIRPDAPELAAYGQHAIGVRTLELVHADQIDVVGTATEATEPARYDRPLTVEVWYPSRALASATPYRAFLRDGKTEVELHGRATRDAAPDTEAGPFPLVLVSHGYPGNRYLMSHLAENLASKGYVVASIDHTDSTYRTAAAFSSTLVHRTLDQLFVLDEMAERSAADDGFLSGLVDADRAGLVGYSMGGYGAVITAGAGLSPSAVEQGAPLDMLAMHAAGSDEHAAHFDERIKAVVAFAPWGMERELWTAEGLAGLRIPTLFVSGSADDVSGYEKGVRAIFEQATGVDRHLLTFEKARHNAAAPMPAPLEAHSGGPAAATFDHYADPVWDTVRMNNIAQHFVTAYFGLLLRGDRDMAAYLDLVPSSEDGVWSKDTDGSETPEHTYWKGFKQRAALGLRFETLRAVEP